MSLTDPISDMLARIKNGLAVNARQVSLPHSIAKEKVARLLADNGWLAGVRVEKNNLRKILVIDLAAEGQPPSLNQLKRLSKPGRRLYVGAHDIPTVKRGRGMVIISTSSGLMTGAEARKKRVGGELICEVF